MQVTKHGSEEQIEVIKPLRCCALHPSGYYMAVALGEKLVLYHILHKELRHFHSYEQKHIIMLKFSVGGQYLWAVDSKVIVLYNTFTLEKLRVVQCLSPQISDITFDAFDS